MPNKNIFIEGPVKNQSQSTKYLGLEPSSRAPGVYYTTPYTWTIHCTTTLLHYYSHLIFSLYTMILNCSGRSSLKHGTLKLWNFETLKLWNSKTLKLWQSENMKLWNSENSKTLKEIRKNILLCLRISAGINIPICHHFCNVNES